MEKVNRKTDPAAKVTIYDNKNGSVPGNIATNTKGP
jgi:hypothetical protein